MRRDIARSIESCATCQYCNRPAVKPSGFLQSLPVTTLFHTVAIDFVGGFASTFLGNKYILVAIDHFSKYVVAAATPNMISATVAQFLLEKIGLIYGFPMRLLSDRGSSFLSHHLQTFLELVQTKKVNTSSYHPECDGQAEAGVKTVTGLLRKLVANSPDT